MIHKNLNKKKLTLPVVFISLLAACGRNLSAFKFCVRAPGKGIIRQAQQASFSSFIHLFRALFHVI